MDKYKAVLFDFDGTLVDLATFVNSYTSEFLKENNIKTSLTPIEFYYQNINSINSNLDPKIINKFKANWKVRLVNDISFIDGSIELIKQLKKRGVKLGIVTTGNSERVKRTLASKSLTEYFDILICSNDVINQKPHPEGIFKALEYLKSRPEETVFIGDNQVDIMAGISAKVDTIFFVKDKNYANYLSNWLLENNPTFTAANYEEIKQIIINS